MKKINKCFELLPHTADLKLRVYGDTLANLFTNAAIGMFQAIEPRIQGCQVIQGISFAEAENYNDIIIFLMLYVISSVMIFEAVLFTNLYQQIEKKEE